MAPDGPASLSPGGRPRALSRATLAPHIYQPMVHIRTHLGSTNLPTLAVEKAGCFQGLLGTWWLREICDLTEEAMGLKMRQVTGYLDDAHRAHTGGNKGKANC